MGSPHCPPLVQICTIRQHILFFAGPDMSEYDLYWILSTYVVISFAGSVFIRAILCVWHVIGLIRSNFIPVGFRTRNTAILVGSFITTGVVQATSLCSRIMYCVLCILLSSTLTELDFTNMTLNCLMHSDNNFVKGEFSMHADAVTCTGGFSAKMRCPTWNCCKNQTNSSEL